MASTFIEDITPIKLLTMIQLSPAFDFKHKDCDLVFTSDGEVLYAYDTNNKSADPFKSGDFIGAIQKYYDGEIQPVIDLLTSLAESGLPLELSDHHNNFYLTLSELKQSAELESHRRDESN